MTSFPIPVRRTAETADFFDMAARGELMLLRCSACSTYRAPQATVCPECFSDATERVAASGVGSLVSWTVVHRSPVPGLDAPYIAALVECAEGPWVFVRLINDTGQAMHANASVVLFSERSGGDGEWLVAARVPGRSS